MRLPRFRIRTLMIAVASGVIVRERVGTFR